MSRPVLDTQRAIFIHVPKTGGVSIDQFFRTRLGLDGFTGHHAARELQAAYPEKFSSYYKFAFVRNPWDRLVSAFFFLSQGGYSKIDLKIRDHYVAPYKSDFHRFVLDLPSNLYFVKAPLEASEPYVDGLPFPTSHFIEQSYWICNEQGTILTDFVGRFESLDSDFQQVCLALNLPYKALPLWNASDRGDYRSYYTAETRQIVATLFSRDIDLFNYRF